jgi:5-methylcytosine-specific restriction enzyme A
MTAADGDRRPPPWAWDELVLACDLVADNQWRGLTNTDQRVQDLSNLLQVLPIHPPQQRGLKFRNLNSVARKTFDLATNHPAYKGIRTHGGRLDLEVIHAFINNPKEMAATAATIRHTLRTAGQVGELPPDPDLAADATPEGRLLERLHLIRERNPKIRARRINEARQQLGHVQCEVCAFDFEQTYGPRGHDYIECHHKTPLSHSGPTTTALADLALLCSNCHRMIHCKRPWITVEELRTLVTQHTT